MYKGFKHSQETKLKISQAIMLLHRVPPNKGKPCSEIQKEMIRLKLRNGKYINCESCKKIIYINKSDEKRNKRFCSRECYYKDGVLKGEKNHKWKGGTSKYYKKGYYSKQYIKWRNEVFKRDGYKCRNCNIKGFLTVHHVKSFAHYPDLRFDVNNGLTLCELCHSKTDNYKGRAKIKKELICVLQ